jgi:hypothetical protein
LVLTFETVFLFDLAALISQHMEKLTMTQTRSLKLVIRPAWTTRRTPRTWTSIWKTNGALVGIAILERIPQQFFIALPAGLLSAGNAELWTVA